MTIKRIKLTNFKNFDSLDIKIKDKNLLKGQNGSGKTTIRDAILFALYNQTASGNKNTDHFIKKGEECCEVELTTSKHIYHRKQSKNASQLNIDGTMTPQKSVSLPEFDIFNSVFNVGYFSRLPEKTQRQLILNNTKHTSKTKMFIDSGGTVEYLQLLLKILKSNEIKDVDKSIKIVNAKKLRITKEIDYYIHVIEFLESEKKLASNDTLNSIFNIRDIVQQMYSHYIKPFTDLKNEKLLYKKKLEIIYKTLNNIPSYEMRMKSQQLLKRLKKEFKHIKLVLIEPLKSGLGRKDIFRFEINKLPYQDLSNGEKLRFDLIISQFFNSLLKEPIDIYFVDEASILDETPELPVQSFITQISPFNFTIE